MLQNAAAHITKCVGQIYYKMLHTLLNNAHIITKCCNRYYKMRSLLQNASSLQNAAEQQIFVFAVQHRVGGFCWYYAMYR